MGGAVGDALGAPLEFMSAAQIEQEGGALGQPFFGSITDDTQMTLFTADGLLRARASASDPVEAIHRAYLCWYDTQTLVFDETKPSLRGWLASHRQLWSRRAPGLTCMSSLANPARHRAEGNDSKGCGGVMRVAPVGLVLDAPYELAAAAAELTHGHPTSSAASGAFAVLISRLARAGLPLERAVEDMVSDLRNRSNASETLDEIAQTQRLLVNYSGGGIPYALGPNVNGGGWIAEEALAIALYSCLAEPDPVRALVRAVEHDGDSDSTGAIAGNILGALLGPEWIPSEWLKRLELRGVIEQLADDLASEDIGELRERYPPG